MAENKIAFNFANLSAVDAISFNSLTIFKTIDLSYARAGSESNAANFISPTPWN
jgi:hypothetical protein